MNRQNENFEI